MMINAIFDDKMRQRSVDFNSISINTEDFHISRAYVYDVRCHKLRESEASS